MIKPIWKLGLAGGILLTAVGCHTDMWIQPKEEPLGESSFYNDKQASRPLIVGTVPRGHLQEDTAFFTGRDDNGRLITDLPFRLSVSERRALLLRGQERFNVYCTPCHGRLGDGQGMISKRGLALRRPPASYHTERLRAMPIGHFYDVMTKGYGTMFSYASRVEPQDRWAIAAYIRALQLSQHANTADYAVAQKNGTPPAASPGTETQ